MQERKITINPKMGVINATSNSSLTVVSVATASTNPEDIVRGHLIDEIYKLRGARASLHKRFPDLLNHGATAQE